MDGARISPPAAAAEVMGAIVTNKEIQRSTALHHPLYTSMEKSSDLSPTNIESLPQELLFNILLLLPADFLHDKAKLVCSKWYKFIRSKDFINTLISLSTSGLLLTSHSQSGSHPIFVAVKRGRVEMNELSYKCRTKIHATCNGMTLELHQANGKSSLVLINPATKQRSLLPSVPMHRRADCLGQCGIAYSAASMEYKLTLPYYAHHHVCIGLLTVGVDKSWRKVGVRHLPEDARRLLWQPPLTTEGFLHWGRGKYVLTLNVETEILTLSQLPLPKPHPNYCYYLSTGRFLSLLLDCRDFWWEIWEMKRESGEWRKVVPLKIELGALKIRPFQQIGFLRPFGWVKYLEVLAFTYRSTCIFYHLDTHEINTIELAEPCRGFAHKDTLVLLSKSRVVSKKKKRKRCK